MPEISINKMRNWLEKILAEEYGDREDIVTEYKKPKSNQIRLDTSPNKLHGLHIAPYSLRRTGRCCIPISRNELLKFDKKTAFIDNVYNNILPGKEKFIWDVDKAIKQLSPKENKQASQIDPPRPSLSPTLWEYKTDGLPRLKDEAKWFIINPLFDILRQHKLRHPEKWVYRISLTGSITTNQYHNDTDVDINVEIDFPLFLKYNPELGLSLKNWLGIRSFLRRIIYKLNGVTFPNSEHERQYFVISKGRVLESDNWYDVVREVWYKGPNLVDFEFIPDKEFQEIKEQAEEVIKDIISLFGHIKYEVANMLRIKRQFEEASVFNNDLLGLFEDYRRHIKASYYSIKKIQKEVFETREDIYSKHYNQLDFPTSYRYSRNWSAPNIFYKYVEKSGVLKSPEEYLKNLMSEEEYNLFIKIIYS